MTIPTTPEQARAEQERWQKPLEAYEKADAAFEAADTEYWLNQRHLPHPMRITTLKSELNAARKRLELDAPTLARDHAALLGAYAEALEQVKEMQAAIRNLMNIDARHREFLASPEGVESDDAGFSQFRREFDAAYGRLQALAPAEAPK